MGIREEKAYATKKKIVDSARKLIREKGIDGVSVDDIMKDANLAKGSFYVYYKKKEDVIQDIGCMEFRYINDEIRTMQESDVVEILKYYYQRYREGVFSIGVEIAKCWLQSNLNCRCKLEYDLNTIGDIIKKGVEKRQLKDETDVKRLTYRILSNLYGLTQIWIMANGKIEYQQEEAAREIEDILRPFLTR